MEPDAVTDGVSPVRDERSVRSAASGSVTDLELQSWLLRYARGARDRAATWHVAMVARGDSLHDEGEWVDCQHVSCVANREFVAIFERHGIV